MYEYKVLTALAKKCEEVLNGYAKKGWRLAAMAPDQAIGMGLVVTLERQK